MSLNLQQKIATIQEAKDDIKTAIINKGVMPSGNITTYADAISQIDTVNNQSKTATQNGTVYFDEGYTGLSQVTVSVNQSVENKNITENGTYTADTGYIGLGTVTVDVNPTRISKTITDNGVYLADDEDVYGYRQVTVNVPKGIPREVKNGVYQIPSESCTFSLPSNATDLGQYALCYAFYGSKGITEIDLSSLTTISGTESLSYCFGGCINLSTVNLSNLTTISGGLSFSHCFEFCTNLESIDLSSLTTISGYRALGYIFQGCTKLKSVDLSSLTTISDEANILTYAFASCANLNTLSFPSLNSSGFGFYTNQFHNMLYNVTGCIVHFPSNLQSVIGNWSDVQSGFGGTNTTILFDLEATE